MKRLIVLLLSSLLVLGLGISAQAIPTAGVVPTDGGYYRGTNQGWTEAWGVTYGSGPEAAFPFPGDGRITLWYGAENPKQYDKIAAANMFLFSTYNFGASGPTFNVAGTSIAGQWLPSIQIDGYKSPGGTFAGGYYVWNLPDIGETYGSDSPWVKATPSSFPGTDTSGYTAGQKQFNLLSGVFSGDLPLNEWLFLVADLGQDFGSGEAWVGPVGGSGGNNDFIFSPKTTSIVPEPSTLLLLGMGLVGFGIWGRRKFRN